MKYHRLKRIYHYIILTLLFLFILPVFTAADHIEVSKKILIINPFSKISEWGMEFIDGLYSKINSDSSFKTSIYFHFLKSDILTDDNNNKNIEELETLNSAHKFDIVIGILPLTHNFLITEGELLFPEIPKILVAAVDKQIEEIKDKDFFYYLKSSSSLAIIQTIHDIKQMLPDLEHLYVHSGSGVSDLPYLTVFKNEVTKYFDDDIPEYWVGDSIHDIFNKIANVPDNSAIILLTTNNDNYGNTYTIFDFFPQYSEIANAPVFSFYDNEFGLGIVGGTMTSAENYGKHAAIIIDNIVTGKENLIVEKVDTSRKMYDWRQLDRWNIDLRKVPRNAEIMFAEETFWNKYKEILIVSCVIILLQTTTIIFLFNQVKRKKRLHKELENKHVQISLALKEKEILLKEVHHRVKNNLSLVISFLSLQSDYIKDNEMLEILAKLQNRIYAMSLVHEQLYKDNRIEKINISEYLKELCDSAIYSYQDRSTTTVSYDLDLENQNFDMDLMIPIGLIFNELITNSIKHAFKETPAPTIIIKGKREDNRYIFEYSDNGIGLSENAEWADNGSLGLLIVKTLMIQIKGEYNIEQSFGEKVIFSCPVDT